MNFCILIELSKKKISFLYNRSDGESKFTPFVGEGSALPLAIYCLGNDMQIGQFAIDEAMKQNQTQYNIEGEITWIYTKKMEIYYTY